MKIYDIKVSSFIEDWLNSCHVYASVMWVSLSSEIVTCIQDYKNTRDWHKNVFAYISRLKVHSIIVHVLMVLFPYEIYFNIFATIYITRVLYSHRKFVTPQKILISTEGILTHESFIVTIVCYT